MVHSYSVVSRMVLSTWFKEILLSIVFPLFKFMLIFFRMHLTGLLIYKQDLFVHDDFRVRILCL